MDEMQKPAATQPTAPVTPPVTPGKKKSNYMMPVMIAFVAIVAFLAVWYFAVK